MLEDQSTEEILPARIPIFPLGGVLLLPKARLPLNIFEPRYLDMTRDAMAGDRVIGMVQPSSQSLSTDRPAVYGIGGAGRITAFQETKDKRLEITLTGLSRFAIIEELSVTTRYRQVKADWDRYDADRRAEDETAGIDRNRLMTALKAYLELAEIPADWDSIVKAETGPLITSLAMICPFGPAEKQALLEAHDLFERSRIMTALVEMSLLHHASGGREDQNGDDHKIH